MSTSEYELSNLDSNESNDSNDDLNNNYLNNSINDYSNDFSNINDNQTSYIQNICNQNSYKKTKDSIKVDKEVKKDKREINYNATLAAVHERQERLAQMKARIEQKNKNENNRLKLIGGLELLYNIIKKQNVKLADKIQTEFNTSLPFNINLQSTIIKPPYLTPKIVSHRMEKLLNET